MGNNIFKAPDDTSQQMADSLPVGRAWASKNIDDSNTRKLINSLSVAHNLTQQQVELLDDEFRINQTFDLLEDWERSVGIPDECLAASETIEQRRQAVIDRLRKMPIVTLEEVENYVNALFPGLNITLIPGVEYFTFEYDFEISFLGDVSEKFILVVKVPVGGETFEYDFELPFIGGPDTTRLRCLLEKIVPANVYVITEFTGE
jgi:hypothetical protein